MSNASPYKFQEDKLFLPAKSAIGSLSIKHPLNVFTEFGHLKSTIVGYMDDTAHFPEDATANDPDTFIQRGPFPEHMIKKNQEIQNQLAQKLIDLGIEVVRPAAIDHSRTLEDENYKTTGFCCFSPRDLLLFYHDTIYYSPAILLSIHIDRPAYDWISLKLRELGAKWIKPWPRCSNEDSPYWDAANLLKVGLDIVFLISLSGNESGYSNFKQLLEERYKGRVRVHPFRNPESSIHIDTTLTILGWNQKLKKYLITADKKVTNPTCIPPIFRGKNWQVLEITEKHIIDYGEVKGYTVCSPKLAENFFMINSHLAVVDEKQHNLIKLLEFYGIECMACSNPHGRESGGGFHCMTNDWNRIEDKDFNKILDDPTSDATKEELAGYFDLELLELLQSKGDVDKWTEICNREGIFPSYATDHLTKEEIEEMNQRHKEIIIEKLKIN